MRRDQVHASLCTTKEYNDIYHPIVSLLGFSERCNRDICEIRAENYNHWPQGHFKFTKEMVKAVLTSVQVYKKKFTKKRN